MAWAGRGGSGLVGRDGSSGRRSGHRHKLVVGWGHRGLGHGRLCSSVGCCFFSLCIVASVCIARMQLE